ncbi:MULTISPECIES: zinc-finger domain-containing protein [Bacillus]|nr:MULTISPECIES: zinc-finger domain-containing protein [Bacillus]
MNKKAIRIKILDLQDKYCSNCRQRDNAKHCLTRCEIGMQINRLGSNIGGKYVADAPKRRTKADWDKLCIIALAMREQQGLTYAEIARRLGINKGYDLIKQLKKRNLK